jgi:ribosomal protein L40E
MIVCPKCKTENIDNAKFCRNCGTNITQVASKANKSIKQDSEDTASGFKEFMWSIIIVGAVIVMIASNSGDSATTEEAPITTEETIGEVAEEAPAIEEVQPQTDNWYAIHAPLMLPQTGVVERELEEGNAPLEIHTSPSTGNYFVKINNIQTGATVIKAFIRSGEIFSTTLPTGEYELKYANGKNWYGEIDLFGPETSYSKAGETFSFDGYNGYTVELIHQVGGNLQAQSIDAGAF